MASKKNSTLAILFTLSAVLTACDEAGEGPDQVQAQEDAQEVEIGEEDQAVAAVPLSSDAREELFAQFDARGVDRADIDSCGEAGLLASVVGAQGRHFTFCGDGAVMQMIPPGVEEAHKFASKDIVARIQEVAPESTEIPTSVRLYDVKTQLGGVANPVVAGFDYEPKLMSSQDLRSSCNDVRSDCRDVKKWAYRYPGANLYSSSWCYNRDDVSDYRDVNIWDIAGWFDPTIVIGIEGKSFVSACEGETVTFRTLFQCEEGGTWYRKHKKTVNEYERVVLELGGKVKTNKCRFPMNHRFKAKGGDFVMGGGFRITVLTF